ncbi:hypothetical protein, partial [Streptomyces lycii]
MMSVRGVRVGRMTGIAVVSAVGTTGGMTGGMTVVVSGVRVVGIGVMTGIDGMSVRVGRTTG